MPDGVPTNLKVCRHNLTVYRHTGSFSLPNLLLRSWRDAQRFGDEELLALQAIGDHLLTGHRLQRFVAHAGSVVTAQPQPLALGRHQKRLMLAPALGLTTPWADLDAAASTHASIVCLYQLSAVGSQASASCPERVFRDACAADGESKGQPSAFCGLTC
jgi:hypothetical protein